MFSSISPLREWIREIGAPGINAGRPPNTFRLRSWFAIVSLASIGLLTLAGTTLLSRLMTERMLRQEGVLTMEFVQSTFLVERPTFLYGGRGKEQDNAAEGILVHLSSLPDVLRANLYTADRQLYWSSDKTLIGRRFSDNPELERALAGNLVINEETESGEAHGKGEHANLHAPADESINYFVEIYVPIWDQEHKRVVGAVELYKRPQALFEAIKSGRQMLWIGAFGGALFLYAMLYWLIGRADAVIRDQQSRLVESERLAAVGELGSAVAHGIRNPLAAIRSSAELALEGDQELSRESARDIMAEADRLEAWINELLSYSRPVAGSQETVDVAVVLQRSLEGFGRELERRHITRSTQMPATLPPVVGNSMLFAQVFNSLLANAAEALENHGSISLRATVSDDGKAVQVCVADDGPGMTQDQLAKAFRPFYTTKTKGLGVGLPLAKRIVERFGGSISIGSKPGQGTTVRVAFAIAA
jgi:two-component system sensor histidine kinase HydH